MPVFFLPSIWYQNYMLYCSDLLVTSIMMKEFHCVVCFVFVFLHGINAVEKPKNIINTNIYICIFFKKSVPLLASKDGNVFWLTKYPNRTSREHFGRHFLINNSDVLNLPTINRRKRSLWTPMTLRKKKVCSPK